MEDFATISANRRGLFIIIIIKNKKYFILVSFVPFYCTWLQRASSLLELCNSTFEVALSLSPLSPASPFVFTSLTAFLAYDDARNRLEIGTESRPNDVYVKLIIQTGCEKAPCRPMWWKWGIILRYSLQGRAIGIAQQQRYDESHADNNLFGILN